jgi:regulator of replication initiation timing
MRTIESLESSEYQRNLVEELRKTVKLLAAENAALREDKARLEKALSDFKEYHNETLDEWSERC